MSDLDPDMVFAWLVGIMVGLAFGAIIAVPLIC